jgi:hypothetical protein
VFESPLWIPFRCFLLVTELSRHVEFGRQTYVKAGNPIKIHDALKENSSMRVVKFLS